MRPYLYFHVCKVSEIEQIPFSAVSESQNHLLKRTCRRVWNMQSTQKCQAHNIELHHNCVCKSLERLAPHTQTSMANWLPVAWKVRPQNSQVMQAYIRYKKTTTTSLNFSPHKFITWKHEFVNETEWFIFAEAVAAKRTKQATLSKATHHMLDYVVYLQKVQAICK